LIDTTHFELVDGDLIDIMGKKRPHIQICGVLAGLLQGIFGLERVNTEATVDVSPEDRPTNQPQPDIIVLSEKFDGAMTRDPRPSDLDLVVEIADTTLFFDLSVKAALYSRAQVEEYWVVDVQTQRVLVHTKPEGGVYQSIRVVGLDEALAPGRAPEGFIDIRRVFAKRV
jgi:Uma2 family endonuclease